MGCSGSAVNQGRGGGGTDGPANKRLLEEYAVGHTLGEGAFGVVYACTHRASNEEFAVKMVDKVETPVEAIRKEAELLKSMDCKQIVKVHQIYYERCFVCIVMDKFSGGDLVEGLHAHLKEKGKIPCFEIVHVSFQMGRALEYLHARNVVHRDVKGDNYLMSVKTITDPNNVVALADFGAAVTVKEGERLNSEVGTRIFWAPEFCNKSYGMKVDVWAMGVIMYGLLDGRFPFKDEKDIKTKEPKLPRRLHADCEDYLRGMLTKDEEKRLSSAQVVAHRWMANKGRETNGDTGLDSMTSEVYKDNDAGKEMKVNDNDEGITERRRELLERLNQAEAGKQGKKKKAAPSQHYWAKWFTIVDKHQAGSTLKFEWWDAGQVEKSGVLKFEGLKRTEASDDDALGRSPELVGKMLGDHNIDISAFGQGQAKSLQQMAGEVAIGSARLMLDATEHKKLVRVVDVVLLRIYNKPDKSKLIVETGEQFPDGRKRAIARLPGTKKDPHESSRQTATRYITDMMGMGDCKIVFDYEEKDAFEEEFESPSYPGVKTVYRKEILEGYVACTDKDVLARISLPAAEKGWSVEDKSKNTKFLNWMGERDAVKKGVKLRSEGTEEVSGLVSAPIGLNEEDLRRYLVKYNIPIEPFGRNNARTLKEFSTELVKGESSIQVNTTGEVVRIVDLIIMKIENPQTGDVLMQTEQTFGDGTKTLLNRLPGAKRRPDENQFVTARRLLRKQLKIEENNCILDAKGVQYYEEQKTTQAFPGVKTIYRKRLIRAEVIKS